MLNRAKTQNLSEILVTCRGDEPLHSVRGDRPTPVVDYGWCQWPNQLSGEIEQGPLAKGSAGGVRENLALLGV